MQKAEVVVGGVGGGRRVLWNGQVRAVSATCAAAGGRPFPFRRLAFLEGPPPVLAPRRPILLTRAGTRMELIAFQVGTH